MIITDLIEMNVHSCHIESVDFAPDGKTIVAGCHDGTINVWDAGQPLGRIPTAISSLLMLSPCDFQALWS